jgi:alcohol dehydrogenase (NADP+)
MIPGRSWAAQSLQPPLAPYVIDRHQPGPYDVRVDIHFCVCHSDTHQVRGEWEGGIFPMVTGHEIVRRVAVIGPKVTRLSDFYLTSSVYE